MARIQLSGIVTSINGSVGGTTVRKNQFGFQAYNKSNGTSLSRLMFNSGFNFIRKAQNHWRALPDDEKRKWNNLASTTPFQNNFGNTYFLNGYQFYVKYNAKLFLCNAPSVDAVGWRAGVSAVDFGADSILLSLGYFNVEFNCYEEDSYMVVSFERLNTFVSAPIFNRKKADFVSPLASSGIYNVLPDLLEKFPNLKAGDNIRTFFYIVSQRGVVSEQTFLDRVVS